MAIKKRMIVEAPKSGGMTLANVARAVEDYYSSLCQLCGKSMDSETGDNHKACEDYEACQADRDI